MTPRTTVIAALILVLESTSRGYESLLVTLRSFRKDLMATDSCPATFCRAKMKLSALFLAPAWEAFRIAMNRMFGDVWPRVYGHRLLAFDGVWINAKRSKRLFKDLRKRCRGRPPKDPKGQPQVLLVVLVDVLTRTPIAWEFVTPGQGERPAAVRLLAHVTKRDILLADRGFPSRHLLDCMVENGNRFIMRMQGGSSAFTEVAEFLGGTRKDRSVIVAVSKRTSHTAEMRLLRGRPSSSASEEWILLTNLSRNARWTRSIILSLYHERWGIEIFFRELKQHFSADQFHSLTTDGLHAEIAMAMLAASLVSAAELIALTVNVRRMPRWNDLQQRRCNRSTLATIVLNALKSDPAILAVADMLDRELGICAKAASKRRPGRSYPRICKSFYGKWKHVFNKRAA